MTYEKKSYKWTYLLVSLLIIGAVLSSIQYTYASKPPNPPNTTTITKTVTQTQTITSITTQTLTDTLTTTEMDTVTLPPITTTETQTITEPLLTSTTTETTTQMLINTQTETITETQPPLTTTETTTETKTVTEPPLTTTTTIIQTVTETVTNDPPPSNNILWGDDFETGSLNTTKWNLYHNATISTDCKYSGNYGANLTDMTNYGYDGLGLSSYYSFNLTKTDLWLGIYIKPIIFSMKYDSIVVNLMTEGYNNLLSFQLECFSGITKLYLFSNNYTEDENFQYPVNKINVNINDYNNTWTYFLGHVKIVDDFTGFIELYINGIKQLEIININTYDPLCPNAQGLWISKFSDFTQSWLLTYIDDITIYDHNPS